MNYEIFQVPVKALPQCADKASVTALHAQGDGTLLCGLAFARPALFRISLSPDSKKIKNFEDMKIEEKVGEQVLGIMGGLRPSTSGDTAFAVLHGGFLPAFLRRLLGGDPLKLSSRSLLEFLIKKEGGLGAFLRHSVIQISENEIMIRRHKEAGVLYDVAHIGDFLFGLSASAIWREPYLNSEKREVLRGDLSGNGSLHRDDDGTFWLASRSLRVLRLGQTEIKAKPTPLKLTEATLGLSAASQVDGWLYVTTSDSKELIRIRRNPVSFEEEMQKIALFNRRITALVALEDEGSSKIVMVLEGNEGCDVKSVVTLKAEDPESLPAIPPVVDEGRIPDVKSLSSLTRIVGTRELWAGESRLNSALSPGGANDEKTRLLRISGL